MASSLRQLPANYVAHSALDFGRKGWLRTLTNLASLVVWFVCSGLLVWIVVLFRPDAGKDAPVFGQAEGPIAFAVLAVYMFLWLPYCIRRFMALGTGSLHASAHISLCPGAIYLFRLAIGI